MAYLKADHPTAWAHGEQLAVELIADRSPELIQMIRERGQVGIDFYMRSMANDVAVAAAAGEFDLGEPLTPGAVEAVGIACGVKIDELLKAEAKGIVSPPPFQAQTPVAALILCPVCERNVDGLRGVRIETAVQEYLVSIGRVATASLSRCYVRPGLGQTSLATALYDALEDLATHNMARELSDEDFDFYRLGQLCGQSMHTWSHGTPVWKLTSTGESLTTSSERRTFQRPWRGI